MSAPMGDLIRQVVRAIRPEIRERPAPLTPLSTIVAPQSGVG